MLFDASLDGIEDSSNEINHALGLANLAAAEWFVQRRETCAESTAEINDQGGRVQWVRPCSLAGAPRLDARPLSRAGRGAGGAGGR